MLKIVKEYPPRGPLQQFRLEKASAFHCFRCTRAKKAKLRTIYGGDTSKLLCNGCYGRLLSIYDVKAGTSPDDERANELSLILLKLASEEQSRAAGLRNRLISQKSEYLSEQSLRFLGTSEYVANSIAGVSELDWSVAVIGLCKAVEIELLLRIIEPLKEKLSSRPLDVDLHDADLRTIARYCSGGGHTPTLGNIRHFLRAAKREHVGSSPTLDALEGMVRDWPKSSWLFHGALPAIRRLTQDYRNRAAHIDTLVQDDYSSCKDLVIGVDGILWQLIDATSNAR